MLNEKKYLFKIIYFDKENFEQVAFELIIDNIVVFGTGFYRFCYFLKDIIMIISDERENNCSYFFRDDEVGILLDFFENKVRWSNVTYKEIIQDLDKDNIGAFGLDKIDANLREKFTVSDEFDFEYIDFVKILISVIKIYISDLENIFTITPANRESMDTIISIFNKKKDSLFRMLSGYTSTQEFKIERYFYDEERDEDVPVASSK